MEASCTTDGSWLAHIKRWQSYREHEKQRTEKACAGTADLTHSACCLGSHAHRSVQSAASTNACQQITRHPAWAGATDNTQVQVKKAEGECRCVIR